MARAGISDLEVGFSARNLREWTQLAVALAAFPLIETDAAHVRRARQRPEDPGHEDLPGVAHGRWLHGGVGKRGLPGA
ncbi:MAG: hypothetical protein ACREJV_07865, partial [Candidatus Rokuibacteriota bacterium]